MSDDKTSGKKKTSRKRTKNQKKVRKPARGIPRPGDVTNGGSRGNGDDYHGQPNRPD